MSKDDTLQVLCRQYLKKLRPLAEKFNLGAFVDDAISKNARNECAGTEEEVQMLSRMCNEERINRREVSAVVGMSYRQCVASGIFNRLKRLRRSGIYSKVDALILKSKLKIRTS